jgi:hypothetical protein
MQFPFLVSSHDTVHMKTTGSHTSWCVVAHLLTYLSHAFRWPLVQSSSAWPIAIIQVIADVAYLRLKLKMHEIDCATMKVLDCGHLYSPLLHK